MTDEAEEDSEEVGVLLMVGELTSPHSRLNLIWLICRSNFLMRSFCSRTTSRTESDLEAGPEIEKKTHNKSFNNLDCCLDCKFFRDYIAQFQFMPCYLRQLLEPILGCSGNADLYFQAHFSNLVLDW